MKKRILLLLVSLISMMAVLFGFSITALANDEPNIVLNATSYEFQNKPLGPGFTVYDGDKILEKNVDYTYRYCSGRVEPGEYYVTVTFIGDYAEYGSVNKYYEITGNKAEVKLNSTSYVATGKPLGPGFTVTYKGKTLEKNVDYTYLYSPGRVEPGEYYVTVTLKGDYRGTIVEYYEITENKIDVILNNDRYEFQNRPLGPGFRVVDSFGKELEKNVDYTYVYSSGRVEPGTYSLTVTLTGKYAGTITKYFEITGNKADVKLNATAYEFQNKPLGPGFTVTYNGKTLQKDVDYTYLYSKGRVEPGEYYVTVTLKGNYRGTITEYYNIIGNKVDVKLNSTSYEFQNKPLGPGFSVTYNGKTLQKDIDYTYVYSQGRIEPGTYSVTVNLKGNYRGSVTKEYKITNNRVNITLNNTHYEYTGSPLGPGMTITDSWGRTLVYKKDYTINYGSGRINPGKYTITINLQGNYRGTEKASFYITPNRVQSNSIRLSAAQRALVVRWDKNAQFTSGYQVQCSESSNFRNAKIVTVTSGNAELCNVRNLFDDTRYYIRVRAYTNAGGETIYSPWSSAYNSYTKENEMIVTARKELGNKGGKKYWQWAGYGARVAWCCIFVGWVGDQNGYVDSGVIPVYQQPRDTAEWFRKRGRMQSSGYTPHQGDLIFMDWNHYGYPHHIGIVEYVENGKVHTIEGNAYNPYDTCTRLSYDIDAWGIYGYATPAYR